MLGFEHDTASYTNHTKSNALGILLREYVRRRHNAVSVVLIALFIDRQSGGV